MNLFVKQRFRLFDFVRIKTIEDSLGVTIHNR